MSKIVELILDEEDILAGVDAISIVEMPAIEENFVALNKEPRVELAEVDKERRVLMGAALIPNKMIYRRNDEGEYHIFFSKDTIRKVSELFLTKGNQNKATLEHAVNLSGLSVVESWIVEGENDKSRNYGLNMPEGTWMISLKVYNDEVWEDYVKTGKVKGFSIEGYFADKVEMKEAGSQIDLEESIEEVEAETLLNQIKQLLSE